MDQNKTTNSRPSEKKPKEKHTMHSRSCEQKIGQCVKNLVALQYFILAYWLVVEKLFQNFEVSASSVLSAM